MFLWRDLLHKIALTKSQVKAIIIIMKGNLFNLFVPTQTEDRRIWRAIQVRIRPSVVPHQINLIFYVFLLIKLICQSIESIKLIAIFLSLINDM